MIYFPFSAEENLDKTCERYRETPWLYAEDTAQLKAEAGLIFLQNWMTHLTQIVSPESS